MTEWIGRSEGKLCFGVVGPVEDLMAIKKELRKEPVSITGGQL